MKVVIIEFLQFFRGANHCGNLDLCWSCCSHPNTAPGGE